MHKLTVVIFALCIVSYISVPKVSAEDDIEPNPKVDEDLGASREGSRTDSETVAREEEAIKLDGLSVAQMKELKEKSEKHVFQAEVNRMMKLIINSLYKNKEIFLRELISNASDALDKIRLLSLTDRSALDSTPEMTIRIKADKENKMLHITDTGIGMTKEDLIKNLGTIAKSGTSDFLAKMAETGDVQQLTDMIGQFGVGFYSSFLVSDNVIVTSKNNADKQYIWESDSSSFSIVEDPREDTLPRGTTVSLVLKDEAQDFLELDTLKKIIKKYSQFINFDLYLWESKTEEVEEPLEEDEEKPEKSSEDGEVEVEEDKDDKPKTKKVSKTTWDWVKQNDAKPIWTKKPADVEEAEYEEFYKALTKDSKGPLAKTHFIAEGEVTFKSLLYVPRVAPSDMLRNYGTKTENIRLYVRRVFITDDFKDMIPSYLSFVRGIVDSDDLPLNVSREDLQQHKLLKVIKKKLVRKVIDMLKKLSDEDYEQFWKEYSTSIKLGVFEDASNRSRLAKLLRFYSSNDEEEQTSLADYVKRMKDGQEHIYFVAGANRKECETFPFAERLLKKGYEVLYLTEPIDEYAISSLPEFEGKKFQNTAKEGLTLKEDKDTMEELQKTYEPLTKWLGEDVLSDEVGKVAVSNRLTSTPCALVASQFGWTGNMERIVTSQTHTKADDPSRAYYQNQRKTLEINPRHPLIKEMLRLVEEGSADETTRDMARMLYRTSVLRSGFQLKDTVDFAASIETMMRKTLGVPLDEQPEEEPAAAAAEEPEEVSADDDAASDPSKEEHDEL
ncbi:endoplasmin homolog [Amphibalanus amphitrite]|uniref:endoplasmin homolog n=1 Tax=Amphibalanus amphitrite TaxID=1232801 RepID=UPI001C924134|nr:endoplasmin homolog [Amphibalanus amphitrite]